MVHRGQQRPHSSPGSGTLCSEAYGCIHSRYRQQPCPDALAPQVCDRCDTVGRKCVIAPKTMKTTPEQNKKLVLEAFDTLFNKRDYSAAEKFWSPKYIQHSAHIPHGRDGLFNLIKASPPSLRYEHGLMVAEGDFVMVHGRYSNIGLPVNWIIVDIVRIEAGVLAEHWDVIQDEATREQSKSGLPMFGTSFAKSK